MKVKKYQTYLPPVVILWLRAERERTGKSICRIIADAVKQVMEAQNEKTN